ncbi:MAG: penicillin-binding protein 2 [Pseudomonadota bacterium]|nr:penicillin-binding protein 2 [Pseudomonadota bacterium]MEC7959920.1 penicillin-binding protein 2 [Pseudomonadota bacterium]MEC8003703.1 penicillin-binding protein 2 [Pseudomonadota bacterium]MEC8612409.1 penicillin-binding protein 2 [Pseudomonadota bacterium]MED6301095.1 penicillin-binding protein 2 [Pseudomonadota bacterium]
MARQLNQMQDWARETRITHGRVTVLAALMVLVMIGLLYRYFSLQVIQNEEFRAQSDRNRIAVRTVAPTRGVIVDRSGNLLAVNQPSFTLAITPERAEDLDNVLIKLSDLLGLTETDIELFKEARKRRRPLSPVPLKYRLTDEELAVIAVNKHVLSGVSVLSELTRHYPEGDLLGHALGYVGRIGIDDVDESEKAAYRGISHIGKVGLEAYYEDVLRGGLGVSRVETNARGVELDVIDRIEPVPGAELTLHLDIELQRVAAAAMGDMRGAVVALDPRTGGVLSAVSSPRYDPNKFVNGISFSDYAELRDSRDAPLLNRVIQGQYPPASTIKPMLGLAGLNRDLITIDTTIPDPGYYQLPGDPRRYRDWILRVRGTGHAEEMNLRDSIAQSCDVYFYELANRLGIDALAESLDDFGIGSVTGVDLPSEKRGILPSSEWKRRVIGSSWYGGETLIVGIGQGYMLATPMQLAVATTALATRGTAFKPTFVAAVDGTSVEPEPLLNVSAETAYWDEVFAGMVDTVSSVRGTAFGMRSGLTYSVAGKTGTAQVVGIAQDATYDEEALSEYQRNHGWFIAFAPVENPEIVLAVLTENSGGGSSAYPVARAMLDYWMSRDE